MAAKFYTAYELHAVWDRAVEIAAEGVESFFRDIGLNFGRTLFFTCMQLWKKGLAMTYARLNSRITPKYFVIIQLLSMRLKNDSTINLSRNAQFVDT